LVVNKVDLAPHVGVDRTLLEQDTAAARGARPYVMASLRSGVGVDEIVAFIRREGGV
jgi:urease accessory protein